MSEEFEAFENSLSEAERFAFRTHSFSCYTLDGNHLPHPYEREDLLATLIQMKRYVVDTNSNWKAESRKPENRENAFILGRTLSDEESNVKGIFFSSKVDTKNQNLFILGVEHAEDEPVILIERLDPYYRSTFDEASLDEESKPRERRTGPLFLKREERWMKVIKQEKQAILLVLGVKDVSELRLAKEMTEKRAQLRVFIDKEASRCLGNYLWAVGVARHCYALLLIEDRQIRTEFSKPDYRNVLGDAFILHNALFLRADILSNDKPLKRMASYAGIPCLNTIL